MAAHVARMQPGALWVALRLHLIKIGGWVRQRLDGIWFQLASRHPGEPL
jgi:hypothetical protein